MNVIRNLYEKQFISQIVKEAKELCNLTYKNLENRKPSFDELSAFTYAYTMLKDERLFKEIISDEIEV